MESLIAIKRAGADMILTYFAQGRGGRAAAPRGRQNAERETWIESPGLQPRVLRGVLLGELDVDDVERLVADDADLVLLGVEREAPRRLDRLRGGQVGRPDDPARLLDLAARRRRSAP